MEASSSKAKLDTAMIVNVQWSAKEKLVSFLNCLVNLFEKIFSFLAADVMKAYELIWVF